MTDQPQYGSYVSQAPDMSQLIKSLADQSSSMANAINFSRLAPETSPIPKGRPEYWSLPGQDPMNKRPDGFANNVPAGLVNSESSGNWFAKNNVPGNGGNGHYGALQFSIGRLNDAKKAGIIPSSMTPEQFRQDPTAQINVTNWHFADIDNRIFKNGLDYYVGKNVGGQPVSMDSLRSMAHLGGFVGMTKYLQSDGQYNPADAFGTTLSAYGKKFY